MMSSSDPPKPSAAKGGDYQPGVLVANDGNNKPSTNDLPSSSSLMPVAFTDLFRFCSLGDKCLFAFGFFMSIMAAATLPGICVVFGQIIDAIADPLNIEETVSNAALDMLYVGIYGFITFFLAFWTTGMAAAKIANSFRTAFLEAVLRQDGTFFDHVEPGSVSLMLSDAALDIQTGLSDKFAAGVQGMFQLAFGFAVAFYFGPLLSLVTLACSPPLILVTTAMGIWGAQDGMFGKEAYSKANGISVEALLNIRTVLSLNAETTMSQRYDSKLGESQKSAIRQSARAAFLSGLMMLIMFVMYGVGLWYGAILIAKSTDAALEDHPAPEALFNPPVNNPTDAPWEYLFHYALYSADACSSYIQVENSTTVITDALAVCACGLPWDSVGMSNPKCGCGFSESNSGFDVSEGCFSGGQTLLVFFSIMLGGFSAGQVGPGINVLNAARLSAAKMIKVIQRYPKIDIFAFKNKKRLSNKLEGKIVFENVHFRYTPKLDIAEHLVIQPKDKDGKEADEEEQAPQPPEPTEGKLVFSGCNLTMEPGQTVALVGESGCGKSTIAKLVQRFYDPTQGRILLDGTDLKEIALMDLRANIGVVSQEPLLFDKSIKENIRYGKMDATDAEIVMAAKSANAHGFISRFPDAYETRVGPKGSKLSGGQKQRVAIARAILRNPAILILDEATSALDNKSEKIVQKALDKLVSEGTQRTTIVIAHRLSTVRNADKIVVLGSSHGTSTAVSGSIILEEGTHNELMAKEGGFYKALVGVGGGAVAPPASETASTTVDIDTADVEFSRNLTEEGDEDGSKSGEDTETESMYSMPSASKDSQEALTEEESFWTKLIGGSGGEKEKEKEEADKMKDYTSRVWNYTKPEMPWIAFGTLASVLKGSIFPLLSLVFSEMLAIFYESDTQQLRDDALSWSYLFYAIGVASLVFEMLQKSIFEMVGERLTQRLRSDLFRSMLRQDLTWFEDEANALGTLSSCLSTDVKLVRLVGGQSMAAMIESLSALACGIAISLSATWEIFLIMVAMVPLLGICEGLQWMALLGSEGSIRSELSHSTDKLHETISGIREVQAFSLERHIADELQARIHDQIIPASKKSAVLKGLMMGLIQIVQFAVYAFAFWFGGKMISNGRIDFQDFNTALWAMAFAASGLGQAALFAGDAAKAAAAVKSIFDRLDHVPTILNEPWENKGLAVVENGFGAPVERALNQEPLKDGMATFEGVNFAYPTRKAAKIFDHIDLVIPSGKVVALVGSSGSGKSTVIQLLERFYDPIYYKDDGAVGLDVPPADDNGEIDMDAYTDSYITSNGVIRLNSADMKESDIRWLRKNMSLVGQEPVLFDDTIYNNIALAKPNCTQEEVEAAAKKANAFDFIMEMDKGFDSFVGTAGSKISGGQKQRIAIARALINNPKILLLDEATSALDNESEKIVQASLDKLVEESGGERTTLIVAHRLSTIQRADIICVLENNGSGSKVCEQGNHEELLTLGGKYKALIEAYEH